MSRCDQPHNLSVDRFPASSLQYPVQSQYIHLMHSSTPGTYPVLPLRYRSVSWMLYSCLSWCPYIYLHYQSVPQWYHWFPELFLPTLKLIVQSLLLLQILFLPLRLSLPRSTHSEKEDWSVMQSDWSTLLLHWSYWRIHSYTLSADTSLRCYGWSADLLLTDSPCWYRNPVSISS